MTHLYVSAQYRWDAKDPLDLNVIDFGDNKVLLYNGIAIGLSLLIDKNGKGDAPDNTLPTTSLQLQYWPEYRIKPLSDVYKLSWRRRYQLRKYLYLGYEPHISFVRDSDIRTWGIGCTTVFEWHIWRRNNMHLIYDNGVGPNYFFQPFPHGGTRFNFTTYYGLRLEFKIGQNWSNVGIYNFHISNADIKGRERNPALDAIGLSIGTSL